ncbi:MAG: tyrosine-type recombinase/integrase [Bacteroidota bacterium]|nr:tyrosine-type recombinase/integrase [Bacteroidota bacterium]
MNIIKKFGHFLINERNYSLLTAKAYLSDVNSFLFFSKKEFNKDLEYLTSHEVRLWIVSLKKKKNCARTINRKISSLKSFFEFCIRETLIKENPMINIRSLKTSILLPNVLSSKSLDKLFDSKLFFGNDFIGVRDRFILEMFYMTGIRLSELINIKVIHFDKYSAQLKVTGKRRKQRILPLTPNIIKLYDSYMKMRNEQQQKSEYLFYSLKGQKSYEKMIYRIVNKYLKKISSLKKTSPHVLRHAFATHLINNGANLNSIKELLGHNSLLSTQVYTHISSDKIKKVFKETHPRG